MEAQADRQGGCSGKVGQVQGCEGWRMTGYFAPLFDLPILIAFVPLIVAWGVLLWFYLTK